MRRIYWILLGIAAIGGIVLCYNGYGAYSHRDEISGISSESFLRATSGILSPSNLHFLADNISISNITYLSDTTALVDIHLAHEGSTVHVLFELRGDHIYLTNYSVSAFTANDFATDSDDVQRVINITQDTSQ